MSTEWYLTETRIIGGSLINETACDDYVTIHNNWLFIGLKVNSEINWKKGHPANNSVGGKDLAGFTRAKVLADIPYRTAQI